MPTRMPQPPENRIYAPTQFKLDANDPWPARFTFGYNPETAYASASRMRNQAISIARSGDAAAWIVFHLRPDGTPGDADLIPQQPSSHLDRKSFHELVLGLFHAVEHQCDTEDCTGHYVAECLDDQSEPHAPPAFTGSNAS